MLKKPDGVSIVNELLEALKKIPDDLRELPDDEFGLRDKVCAVFEGYVRESEEYIKQG